MEEHLGKAVCLFEHINRRRDLFDMYLRRCSDAGQQLTPAEKELARRTMLLCVCIHEINYSTYQRRLYFHALSAFNECLKQWTMKVFDYPWSPLSLTVWTISQHTKFCHRQFEENPSLLLDGKAAQCFVQKCIDFSLLDAKPMPPLVTSSHYQRALFLLQRVRMREDLVDEFREECKIKKIHATLAGDLSARTAILNSVNVHRAMATGSKALMAESVTAFFESVCAMKKYFGEGVPFDYPRSSLSSAVWALEIASRNCHISRKDEMTISNAVTSIRFCMNELSDIGDDIYINVRRRSVARNSARFDTDCCTL